MLRKDKLIYWIWLSLACRIGSTLPSTLLKYFSSPEKIYEAGEEDFAAVDVPFYGHEKELCNKDLSAAKSVLAYCRKNEIGVATPEDYFYPDSFRRLPNKPIVLYYLGNFCDMDQNFIAGIVGAREHSEYALHAAKQISYDLARSGAIIVSGMARGIDAAAHRAALYCGSKTIGVLGCGIDRVYPKENAALYESVIRNGLLITEFPPGTPPNGRNFPIRNRLIAALSDAVCVIEGSETSGSLITAEYALRFGKPLYTVPGSIFSAMSAGSNFLLKLGAKPLLSAFDVLDDFKEKYPSLKGSVSLFKERGKEESEARKRDREKAKRKKKAPNVRKELSKYVFTGLRRLKKEEEPIPPQYHFTTIEDVEKERAGLKGEEQERKTRAPFALAELSEAERALLNKLSFEPVFPDTLVGEGEKTSELLVLLTKLEMKGLVRRVAGGRVVLQDRAEV